ncbi:hypothetical protein CWB96_19780 [Pseudoalteromonas citrea]|uniref:HTH cro/C1-type domain-containing protein n=1 Tax=Pseudoalteromonas citrea TaxID=43655 RepID=A0A5S3XJ90_9GAMM|nr:helix-turn-helix domain-containing protein [Pseudoalteromonas citrea]TMP40798.1 hypothetical protein CWB97_16925 [Pseudoalteromonas citrea]TMP54113.1 hypothetical protein CWB96_19780 [Pseudoalteromonas citrea]
MNLLDQQIIRYCLTKIREALKKKSLTYSHVAQLLDTSEVTVKRIMHDDNIKFERLIKLCNIADIAIDVLLNEAVNRPAEHQYFTPAQDHAFAKSEQLLHYFSLLAFEKKPIEEIALQYKLTPAMTHTYLRALEGLELITLLPENKVQFNFTFPIGFSPDSLVLKNQLKQVIIDTTQAIVTEQDKHAFMIVKPLQLPYSMHEKMLDELVNVVDKYAELSEKYQHKDIENMRQVLIVDNKIPEKSPIALAPILDL